MGTKSVARTLTFMLVIVLLLLPGLGAGRAQGANGGEPVHSLHVNSTADPGDGHCDAVECTLREAILAANAAPGPARITVPAGTYTLLADGILEDAGLTGDLDVTDHLDIFGAGAGQTAVDGAGLDRVLHVIGSVHVKLFGITIQNGFVDLGAGLRNDGGTLHIKDVAFTNNLATGLFEGNHTGRNEGGGIFNDGALTLVDVTFDGNRTDQDYFGDGVGGAIVNYGSVRATRTTFANSWAAAGGAIYNLGADVTLNDCSFNRSFVRFFGGAIFNESGAVRLSRCQATNGNESIVNQGDMAITDSTIRDNIGDRVIGGIWNQGTLRIFASTISGNSGSFGTGLLTHGPATLANVTLSGNVGGWGIVNGGALTLVNSTVVGNAGGPGEEGGGISNQGSGNVALRATIIAGNADADCNGTVVSLGHNLDGDGSCQLDGKGDLTADPLLGPLQDNGGPTATHAPQPDSPAVDHIPSDLCAVNVDQRGVARPQGTACDVGAVEIAP